MAESYTDGILAVLAPVAKGTRMIRGEEQKKMKMKMTKEEENKGKKEIGKEKEGEKENSEDDVLYADACGAMDELAKAQQHQARCQDEVQGCCESLDAIVRDLTNFGALLEVACDDLADAGTKTIDLKRKGGDAHDRTRSHRDRCSAEEELNNSLGCLGDLVKDTASATHTLSCGVPDRDSNEAKYL